MLAVSEGMGTRPEDDRTSEVGTPDEDTTSEVGVGTRPVDGSMPEDGSIPEDGSTPDEGSIPDDGRTPEVGSTMEEGNSPEEGNTPDDGKMPVGKPEEGRTSVGKPEEGSTSVGKPDEGSTPVGNPEEGKTPDEGKTSEGRMLDGKIVGTIMGPVPEGRPDSRPDRMLDTTLGTADAGRSEMADDSMLESSGISEETAGGRMPDALAEGIGVGAVDPTPLPVGRTLVSSDTIDERISGTSRMPELVAAVSDVGIAPELRTGDAVGVANAVETLDSPVPRAVVIPMTMPDDGRSGCPLEAEAAALVGRTTLPGTPPVLPISEAVVGAADPKSDDKRPPIRPPEEVGSRTVSGIPPVEPTSGVGVGAISDESRPPIKPPDEVGCKTDSGTPPVEPGTMKGPRMLDAPPDEGAVEDAGAAVGVTMVSGIPPVEATFWPEDAGTSEDASCVG
jgi:hypothetical protein